MLQSLSISNYALIEQSSLQFEKGLTAITGETGSGKSILLGAFGLLLGERADTKAIKDENAKCVVEAVFDLKSESLQSFFTANDLDYEELTTIRREIAPGGKSRAFINDTPIQLTTLKQLGSMLVDIHSQHENSLLGDRDFQFSVTDAFAGNDEVRVEYNDVFVLYKSAKKELEETLDNEAQMRKEMDYIRFQLSEFEKAQIEDVDQQALEQELDTLNNAEQIKSVLANVHGLLDAEVQGALPAMNLAKSNLQKIASFNNQLEEFSTRLESSLIELRELAREIEAYAEDVHVDDKAIESIGNKLSLLYNLQKKHGLNTVEELLSLKSELESKCHGYDNVDDRITALKKQVEEHEKTLLSLAKKLTDSRKKAATQAQEEVKKYFSELSLEHAELSIDITEADQFNSFGKDEIAFLFRANKGSKLQPIEKVASGGEISRVMLAIKASISKHKHLPVLILDEIDQGVSGEVGKKIGEILKEMSKETQLITITHLPQIAGKASQHLKVYKSNEGATTTTHVVLLNEEERINELAEMLSGKNISKAAIENAKELML
jgi:DNA repair protein RecN (Recombination protein N)